MKSLPLILLVFGLMLASLSCTIGARQRALDVQRQREVRRQEQTQRLEETRRQAREELERLARLESEDRMRGAQLRAELAAHPRKTGGARSTAIRCGPYFLYYDQAFMRKDEQTWRFFFVPRSLGYRPPYGFTVSFTPPDADVEWIDEAETVSYAVGPRFYSVLSRGRRIPRQTVTPASYQDAKFHYKIYVRGQLCGMGTEYEYWY